MAEKSSRPPDAGTSLTLLERLRQDDPNAWTLMVRLYTPLVRRWGAAAGVGETDLDDLSQEVFRVAATNMKNFRRDRPGDSFRGWLHGVTRNFLLKHFERRDRSPRAVGGTDAYLRLQELAGPDGEATGDPAGEKQFLYSRALELVRDQFEEKTWQSFWLTVIDGLGTDDAAARLGLSAVAVRKNKSRVLQRLRSQFAEILD
jgi:RNA polymerase sigma-70 factor (ECF subfamily)